MMIERNSFLSLFLTALFVATLCGCDNFDNPLRWEESAIADDLVGDWKAVEGSDAGVRARVYRTGDKTLAFELTFPEDTEATLKSDRYKQRATFLGNVLGSGSLHVLQVRMDSYDEFDKDGESLWKRSNGFQFLRIALAPETGVHIHRPNPDSLGRAAETELASSGLEIDGEAFARCLGDDIRDSLWPKTWVSIRGELRAGFQEVLGLDEQAAPETQQEGARLADLKVDPYAELSHIRNCIARRLPSESLEHVLLEHTDLVFSGGVDGYVRE